MSLLNIEHLNPREQQALAEFVQRLKEQFNGLICSALLFGSKARGESSPDSDLDVLVVVASGDWQVHKQIRYLAADVCLKIRPGPVAPCLECCPSTGNRGTTAPSLSEHSEGWD